MCENLYYSHIKVSRYKEKQAIEIKIFNKILKLFVLGFRLLF